MTRLIQHITHNTTLYQLAMMSLLNIHINIAPIKGTVSVTMEMMKCHCEIKIITMFKNILTQLT